MNTNLQILIKRMPAGIPTEADFELREAPIPEPASGEFLCRTRYLALDPYIRVMMGGRHFLGQPDPGSVLRSRAVAEVVDSRHGDYRRGDRLYLETGMQQYAVSDGGESRRFNVEPAPESTVLGVLGMPGLTAYAGLTQVAKLQAGETILVTAASGAVGCMVGQISRQLGGRPIGLAGSEQKCAWAEQQAGFEACINYKADPVSDRIKELCPDGVDVYFDNAGGEILNLIVANHLGLGARIVICGLISQYNEAEPPPGPNLGPLMGARASILPLIVYDFEHLWDEFEAKARRWFAAGSINYREEMVEGLIHAPALFAKLMRGENFGKTIVHNPP